MHDDDFFSIKQSLKWKPYNIQRLDSYFLCLGFFWGAHKRTRAVTISFYLPWKCFACGWKPL